MKRENYKVSLPEAEAKELCKGKSPVSRGKHCKNKQCRKTRFYRIDHAKLGPLWICHFCWEVRRRVIRREGKREGPDARGMSYQTISTLEAIEERSGPDGWIAASDFHGQAIRSLLRRELIEIQYRVTEAGKATLDAWEAGVLPLDDGYFE